MSYPHIQQQACSCRQYVVTPKQSESRWLLKPLRLPLVRVDNQLCRKPAGCMHSNSPAPNASSCKGNPCSLAGWSTARLSSEDLGSSAPKHGTPSDCCCDVSAWRCSLAGIESAAKIQRASRLPTASCPLLISLMALKARPNVSNLVCITPSSKPASCMHSDKRPSSS